MNPAKLAAVFAAAMLAAPAAYSAEVANQSPGQSASQSANQLVNQLKEHSAPYLALHGDDPVAWQRWNRDAVRLARENDKILYLSVGYYACHWCHVMQRESYRNQQIAEVINRDFVPVKIDRELEPALDARLMDFAQRILGRGGWPLNVFITPDGHPIYAVLYLPPEQFLATLNRMQTLWTSERERVLAVVKNEPMVSFADAGAALPVDASRHLLDVSTGAIMARADLLRGGFGQRNKFPSVPQLQFLLSRYRNAATPDLAEFLDTTLDAMAGQGLHDHLAGGFFRYSVDPEWATPHFEKMLYDNANLADLYLRAARLLENPGYLEVATRTLDFMRVRMWHPDGALVASLSAVDDDEVEGGHYLWRARQLREILSDAEFKLIASVWGLDRPAELEAGNQPRIHHSVAEYAGGAGIPAADAEAVYASATAKLLAARDRRSLPVDDKLLAGWNGLALGAFAKAARQLPASPDSKYAKTAEALRDFLIGRLWDGERLTRALAKGQPLGSAALEDYAFVATGLFHWAELTGRRPDYQLALDIADAGWRRFHHLNGWRREDGTLLAESAATELVPDGASASPAAVLIATSLKLAGYFGDAALKNKALSALNRGDDLLARAPFWYVSQLDAISVAISPGISPAISE